MKLMTLEEFKKTPNNTLFSVCTKQDVDQRINTEIPLEPAEGPFIKTGDCNERLSTIGWNGVIDLLPSVHVIDESRAVTNWCSWDNSGADYTDDNYVFIVYEPKEIQQMINILSVALGKEGAKLPTGDEYYIDGKEILENELFEFAGIKNNESFDYGACDSNLWELIRKYISTL